MNKAVIGGFINIVTNNGGFFAFREAALAVRDFQCRQRIVLLNKL